jgi:hypothetical protein
VEDASVAPRPVVATTAQDADRKEEELSLVADARSDDRSHSDNRISGCYLLRDNATEGGAQEDEEEVEVPQPILTQLSAGNLSTASAPASASIIPPVSLKGRPTTKQRAMKVLFYSPPFIRMLTWCCVYTVAHSSYDLSAKIFRPEGQSL